MVFGEGLAGVQQRLSEGVISCATRRKCCRSGGGQDGSAGASVLGCLWSVACLASVVIACTWLTLVATSEKCLRCELVGCCHKT